MKTKAKILSVLAALCIGVVLVFGASVYYFQNTYSYHDFYKRLQARASIAAKYNFELDGLDAENLISVRREHLEILENEKQYIIPVMEGETAASIANEYQLPEAFIAELLKKNEGKTRRNNVFFAGLKHNQSGKEYLVIVSAENYYASHHLLFLRNSLIGSVVLIFILLSLVSFWFSRHIFDPIREVTDRVREISSQNIHLRLQTSNKNNTEINELINTFNDLLNRMETALETQRNFVSNASHELGTPLTSILGEAEVALRKERTDNEYRNSLQNILHQAERLDQITKSLLLLAQTGFRDKAMQLELVRMDEIIWEAKSTLDQLNPANKIFVDLSLLPENPKKLKVNGNRQLLHLAFANILNNACKYSGNKPVSIFIASTQEEVVISVQDEGIGIPPEEIDQVYNPFFRASNTKWYEGFGIGLPLTRNIIFLHKGQLRITSELKEGTTVTVRLPLAFQNF